MGHLGEILSLTVAVSWTITALFGNEASRRIGAQPLNVLRMLFSFVLLAILLWITIGTPYPRYADGKTWLLLALSGVVGFVFGDYCLFNAYVLIGARFGQLFMTIAPLVAAILGMIFLGERMSWIAWIAMFVTLSGIGMSILGRGEGEKISLKLPFKGILLGIGAGIGQGGGLVLSKLGLQAYEACIPSDAPSLMGAMMPFASTMIRVIAGGVGFLFLLKMYSTKEECQHAVRDAKGIVYTLLATIFGPFVGVSLSLMAVQYAEAGIASTLMALTPVLIIWPYAVLYKQKVTARDIVGIAITMAGVALFFLG